jgi:hypothetical protein
MPSRMMALHPAWLVTVGGVGGEDRPAFRPPFGAVASRRPSCQTVSGTQDPRPVQRVRSYRHSTRRSVCHTRVTTPARHKQAGVVPSMSAFAVLGLTVRDGESIGFDRGASRITSNTSRLPEGSYGARERRRLRARLLPTTTQALKRIAWRTNRIGRGTRRRLSQPTARIEVLT